MVKVRFLQSVVLTGHNRVFNYNDEHEMEEKAAQKLLNQGIVDILKEEEAAVSADSEVKYNKISKKRRTKATEKAVESNE